MNKLSLKQKNVVKLFKEWQRQFKLSDKAEEKYYLSFCTLSEKELHDVISLTEIKE